MPPALSVPAKRSPGTPIAEISEAVAVEVAGAEACAESFRRLDCARDVRAVVVPELPSRRAQALVRAVDYVQDPGAIVANKVLEWNSDREVKEPIAVEVSAGEPPSEEVVHASTAPPIARDVLDAIAGCSAQ